MKLIRLAIVTTCLLIFLPFSMDHIEVKPPAPPDIEHVAYRHLDRVACANCSREEFLQKPGVVCRPTSATSPYFFEHPYELGSDQIYSYVSSGGHFRLWYVRQTADAVPLSDDNANGVPDWVEVGAEAFENAWDFQVQERGFVPPPSDSLYAPPGTFPRAYGLDGRYDVYFLDLSSHLISGFTQNEWHATNHPEYPAAYTSYIVMENDFANKGDGDRETYLRVTAGHEFHHAIQYAYTSDFPRWWMEATAVLMQDQMFPTSNSYIPYTNVFLRDINIPLWKRGDYREYGATIWPQFLCHYYDDGETNLLRQIYNHRALHPGNTGFFTILDEMIYEYSGDTFTEAFGQFTAWNFFTGSRDDGQHYPDGALYREVDLLGIFSYPPNYERIAESDVLPQGLGSNYIRFDNLNVIRSGDFEIQFNGAGEPNYEWHVVLLVFTQTGYHYTLQMNLDQLNSGGIQFEKPYLLDTIVMIPSVASPIAPALSYTYMAHIVTATKDVEDDEETTDIARIQNVTTYPNPFHGETEFSIKMADAAIALDDPLTVKIYNSSGQLVRTVLENRRPSQPIKWDGRNDFGDKVASGTYFYQIQTDKQHFSGKMTLLP